MNQVTNSLQLDRRITGNDGRASERARDSEGQASSTDGWTWVAALIVAALFIVSGYLDQEAGVDDGATSSATSQRISGNSASPSMVINTETVERRSDKGY